MREKKGILIVVSGFSGSGKGTLMKRLLEEYHTYALSVSATTRKPRKGEMHGREYFFKTVDEFEKMIANDELIEYAKFVNNYYGTPKSYVLEQLEVGRDVILEIEIQGALKVKERYPDTLLLFVTPPNAQVLKERLVRRGTEPLEVVESRMRRAVEESRGVEAYDYLIVNDELEACVKEMHQVIQSEHNRVNRNMSFITQIREELEELYATKYV